MDEFAETVAARVRAARAALQRAAAAGDPCALPAALDALEEALLLARGNGIEVPPAAGDDEAMRG